MKTKPENSTKKKAPAAAAVAHCFPLRRLVPGKGWRRPYSKNPHVWEDENGNRVIVHMSINGITYRTAAGKTGFHCDHQEPLKSALWRNASRKRAGLAAARVIMANDLAQATPPSGKL